MKNLILLVAVVSVVNAQEISIISSNVDETVIQATVDPSTVVEAKTVITAGATADDVIREGTKAVASQQKLALQNEIRNAKFKLEAATTNMTAAQLEQVITFAKTVK